MVESIRCVLLIDDDRATNLFNSMVFRKHGRFDHVKSVESGQEALEYLMAVENNGECKPDLIFLNINMPTIDGWEFLSKFNKLQSNITKGIKVILSSISSDPDDVKKSTEFHTVDDFVSKPLSFPLLNEVMDKHFSSC